MRRIAAPLLFLACITSAAAQGFNDFITLINITPVDQRQALVDSLLSDLPGGEAPIREDSLAWFIYSGVGSDMDIAGDMTYWAPDMNMFHINGTDFWYRGFVCPNDSRLDYKFVRDNNNWILDPLNPHTITGGFGPNSELAMPDYVQPPEVEDYGYPECGLSTYTNFYSPQLDNTRTIKVLTPPGYDPEGAYTAFIVHDGLEYISLASLDNVLAWLAVHEPELELPICVCVPPVNRTEEYATTQQELFGQFIVETVIPFIDENFATVPGDPDRWGSLGASYGGDVSLYLAGTYPEHIRLLSIMSPYVPQEQYALIEAQPAETYRIYMNWGNYDIASLIPLIEDFDELLVSHGVEHLSRAYNEGHSWGLWRATIDESLLFLLGGQTGIGRHAPAPEAPRGRLLLVPYPNPFNGGLRLDIRGAAGPTEVRVYDLLGRLRHAEDFSRAQAHWSWLPRDLASGAYLLEVADRRGRSTVPVTYLR